MGRVRRTGVWRRVGGLIVIESPGVAGPPRVAFVAGRSVGSAVRRNRAKRRLREAIRRARLRPEHDYVVVASARVVDEPFTEVVGWLRRGIEGS